MKIRLTGDREKDFVKAFKQMGIDDLDEMDLIRKKYVWPRCAKSPDFEQQ